MRFASDELPMEDLCSVYYFFSVVMRAMLTGTTLILIILLRYFPTAIKAC